MDERGRGNVSLQNLLLFGYLMSLCSGRNMLSLRSLYCDRSIASAKAISLDSAILCFVLQVPISSVFLKIFH